MRISIYEAAAELCGYKLTYIKLGEGMHVKYAKGYIPHYHHKVFWDSAGRCFKKRNRLGQFDLPIKSAEEKLKLEDYQHVCR